jgi:uncharacterized protein DUF4199
MEDNTTPTWKVYLNFGLITGVIIIVLQLVFYLLDLLTSESASFVNIIPYFILLGGIIWGSKSYRDLYGQGFITYGKAFSTGFMVALIASLMISIFTYALYTIDESLIEKILVVAEEKLYEQNLSDSEFDMALSMQKKFISPAIMAVGSFVWMAVVSVIMALITSIFIKKEEYPV